MKRYWTKGDVCEESTPHFDALHACGFRGKAVFSHQRIIDRVHPVVSLRMRHPISKITASMKWIGPGDSRVWLYSLNPTAK